MIKKDRADLRARNRGKIEGGFLLENNRAKGGFKRMAVNLLVTLVFGLVNFRVAQIVRNLLAQRFDEFLFLRCKNAVFAKTLQAQHAHFFLHVRVHFAGFQLHAGPLPAHQHVNGRVA